MAKHKDPADRAHIWEAPAADVPDVVTHDYPHELPRHVHKAGGVSLIVFTPEECDAALADGWSLLPPKETPAKA